MDFKQLEQKYSPRPYHDRNMDFYKLASTLKWLFQAICVAFGLSFVYQSVLEICGNRFGSFVVSLILLGAIELSKQIIISRTYKNFLVYGQLEFFKIVLSVLIVIVSIAVSKNGIEDVYINMNSTPSVIRLDSVLRPYSIELENAKLDTARFKKEMTYWGESQLTKEGREMMLTTTRRIDKIQFKMDSLERVVTMTNKLTYTQHLQLVKAKAQKLSWFVVVIDCLLVISLLYPLYFEKKSLKEFIKANEAKTIEDEKKVKNFDKKDEKETPLPPLEMGESGVLNGFERNGHEVTTFQTKDNIDTTIENTVASDTKNTTFDLSHLDNLTIGELKTIRRNSKKVVNELKRTGGYDKSKAAKKHEAVIFKIDNL